jgi:hypothetical protein
MNVWVNCQLSGQATFVFEDNVKEQRLAAFLLIRALFVVESYDVEYYGTLKRATAVHRSNHYVVDLTPVSYFNRMLSLITLFFKQLDALKMSIKLLSTSSISMLRNWLNSNQTLTR